MMLPEIKDPKQGARSRMEEKEGTGAATSQVKKKLDLENQNNNQHNDSQGSSLNFSLSNRATPLQPLVQQSEEVEMTQA